MITRGTSISGNLHVSEQVFHMNAGRYYTMWATPKWYVFHSHLIAEMPTMFIQQRWSRIYHHWWDDDSNKCFFIKKWIQKKKTIVLPNMFYIIPTWIVWWWTNSSATRWRKLPTEPMGWPLKPDQLLKIIPWNIWKIYQCFDWKYGKYPESGWYIPSKTRK